MEAAYMPVVMKNHNMQQITRTVAGSVVVALMLATQPVVAANQALVEAVASVEDCVSKMDRTVLSKPISQALKMDQAFVQKALLEAGCSVSDLVYIRALAAKTGETPGQILEKHQGKEWDNALKKQGVSEDDIVQMMEDAYADLALKMLEFPRKNSRRTAKN
jgi:tRNA U55 pseudouridine synthase TruB